jgi:transposase
MPSHKSEDYKITAVKYHLENDGLYVNTCKIFKCSERSLKRWIDKYNNQNNITRNNRPAVSYKITQEQVKYALQLLKQKYQKMYMYTNIKVFYRVARLLELLGC